MRDFKIMKCPYCNIDLFRINLSIKPDWLCSKCNRMFEGAIFVPNKEILDKK